MNDDESLFSRWSRRKRATGGAPAVPAGPEPAPKTESEPTGPYEGLSEDEFLEKFGLPDPDTLGEGDDFRAFMANHIPAALRKRALRRLWVSNPVLANVDGLVDYGGDFTDAAMVPEVLETAYRVGKGFLKEQMAKPAPPEDEEAPEDAVAAAPETPDDVSAETAPPPLQDAPEDDPEPPRPRRMAFRTG